MNSDDASTEPSSDSSFGNDLVEDQQDTYRQMNDGPRTPVRGISRAGGSATVSPQTPRTVRRIVHHETKEQSVMDIVRRCLDDSKEDVDLR